MKDFRHKKTRCPSCHEYLDGSSSTDETSPGPQPGDFSVCLCCASLLRYKNDMTFRIFEEQDTKDIDEELREEVAKILLAVKSMQPIMKNRQ